MVPSERLAVRLREATSHSAKISAARGVHAHQEDFGIRISMLEAWVNKGRHWSQHRADMGRTDPVWITYGPHCPARVNKGAHLCANLDAGKGKAPERTNRCGDCVVPFGPCWDHEDPYRLMLGPCRPLLTRAGTAQASTCGVVRVRRLCAPASFVISYNEDGFLADYSDLLRDEQGYRFSALSYALG